MNPSEQEVNDALHKAHVAKTHSTVQPSCSGSYADLPRPTGPPREIRGEASWALMGKLKFLQPFRFLKPTHYWNTKPPFYLHGIFEITGKEGRPDQPDDPRCSIRRIATCRHDCPLGQTITFPESYLVEATVPTDMDSFTGRKEPISEPPKKPDQQP